jgi:hypothetical protein
MMCSRSLCWIASLAAVVLLLSGCNDSNNTAADTMPSETLTTAAPTSANAAEQFDFSTRSPCDWFTPAEIDAIVTSTYEDFGVPLDRDPDDEMDQYPGCEWAQPLVVLDHDNRWNHPRLFVPHAALDESVRVSIQDGPWGLTALLIVDGHREQLFFMLWPEYDNLGGDVEMLNTLGLTIANTMLQQMGWIDSN